MPSSCAIERWVMNELSWTAFKTPSVISVSD